MNNRQFNNYLKKKRQNPKMQGQPIIGKKKGNQWYSGLPQLEHELDFSQIVQDDPFEWCNRYGQITGETTQGDTLTRYYRGKPTNSRYAFKFKVRYNWQWHDQDNNHSVEGMYCKARVVHADSNGIIWWVENEVEELLFETTLHQHN